MTDHLSWRITLTMLSSVVAFTVMNACFKFLSEHYHPFQIVFIRGLTSFPLVLLWVVLSKQIALCFKADIKAQAIRSFFGVSGLLFFIYALSRLSLMQAYSIAMMAPIFVCLMSSIFMRERIGRLVWLATIIGFFGVIIIFRPDGRGLLSLDAMASLTAAVFYAAMVLLTRSVSRRDGSVATVFWHNVYMFAGIGFFAISVWQPIPFKDLPVLFIIGISAFIGQYCLILSYQQASASRVANLEYWSIPISLLIDFLFWKSTPDLYTLCGSAVIIAATILVHRKVAEIAT